jgi:hypothetical protein
MPTIEIAIGETELRRLIDGERILFLPSPRISMSVEVVLAEITHERIQDILRQARNARALADAKAAEQRLAGK